ISMKSTSDGRNVKIVRLHKLDQVLKSIGVIGNKHIPEIYKRASYEQRLELVRGLLDTDGYVGDKGKIEVSFSDEVLGKDVAEVLRTLGIKVNVRQREAKLYGVRKKDRFRMAFMT